MNNYIYDQNPSQRLFGLDLIRAIATGLVLLSHFAKTLEYLGFWGVELFFGLSGYLIGQILWRNFSTTDNWSEYQIINFWLRRWWRTLPNYYLFLGISLLLTFIFRKPLPSLDILSKFVWFGQSFTRHHGWFYEVSWSLCIEEWFYLIFPILLFVFTRCGLKTKITFNLSMLVIFVSCLTIRQILVNEGVAEDLRLITVARLDAIASGVFVSYSTSIFNFYRKEKFAFFLIGIFLILATIIIPHALGMSYEMVKGNSYLLLLAPFSGAILLPFCSILERPNGTFTFLVKGIETISLWSYSIYLSHMPILNTIYNIQDRFWLSDFRGNTYGNLLTKSIGLILILIVSAFLFKNFESPLTRRRPAELNFLRK